MTTLNDPKDVEQMKRDYGSVFASCPCGRTDVLCYRRAHGDMGTSNGPDADRLTFHDTPARIGCKYSGKLLSELPDTTPPLVERINRTAAALTRGACEWLLSNVDIATFEHQTTEELRKIVTAKLLDNTLDIDVAEAEIESR